MLYLVVGTVCMSREDDHSVMLTQGHIEHVSDIERRYVYHVAAGSQGKIAQERGKQHNILL